MKIIRPGRLGGILVTSILILAMQAASAQEPFQLIPEARFFTGMERGSMLVSGETLIPAGGRPGSGTRVDVSSGLGVESGESSSIIFHGLILDNHVLSFDYLMAMPTGVKRIAQSFRFQNKSYPAGSLLETRIDFNWLSCSYGYQVLKVSSFRLAPRIGIHYVNCATTINGDSEEAGVISNTRRLDGVYPVLGLESRFLMPHGIDLSMEAEGIHLITRGFLTMFKVGVTWETYPNVAFSAGFYSRLVRYVEDNQVLNNEWTYSLTGATLGVLFGF
ncbi:MAG: hypothetical protein RDU20_08835 [Desulfomonilaceae bacterium]|nr:hypothetical protein [Desulfomonilaceae bacterium]